MTKIIDTVEEVRDYVQEDYWVTGQSNEKSGYENFYINWVWNDRLLNALEQATSFQGKKIIDLGCAYGQVVASMVKRNYDAYGIDLSDFGIAEGHKEYPPLKSRTIQGSIHELSSYVNESFDFLYSQQVFEHIPCTVCDQLATETFRIAKPGATLWSGLVLDVLGVFQPQGFNPNDQDLTHINLRPKDWWDEKFEKAGWTIDMEFDNRFRNHKISDNISQNYSFFEEYGWHSLCYKK